MKIISFFSAVLLLFITIQIKCQNRTLIIEGQTSYKFNNSKIYVINAFKDKYYEDKTTIDSANIDKYGNFILHINFPNTKHSFIPYPYYFVDKKEQSRYMSNVFYITNQNNPVDIKIINLDSILIKYPPALSKEIDTYNNYFKDIKRKYSALYKEGENAMLQYNGEVNIPKDFMDMYYEKENKISIEEKASLFRYIKKFPSSYIGFWKFVELLDRNRKNTPEFSAAFKNFSNNIKNSFPGRSIATKEILPIGDKFPILSTLKNPEQQKVELALPQSKYTLVDFWFSYCKPCIAELPSYIQLYNKFKDKGLNIISISTDRTNDVPHLRKIINDHNISWAQYLDENGKQASYWNIKSFPTNFLLNDKNEIINKNISVEELRSLLEKQ